MPKGWIDLLWNFFFDTTCAHCRGPLEGERYLCVRCLSLLRPDPEEDKTSFPYLDGYKTFAPYAGVAKTLVKLIKFDGVRHLARFLGVSISRSLFEYKERIKPDVTGFIPTHPLRLWYLRGFDPVGEALKAAGLRAKPLLRRRLKPAKPLAAVGGFNERLSVVSGSYYLPPRVIKSVRGARVLMIDDLLTTGATASTAAALLKAAGAKEVFLFAFFRAGG